MKSRFRETKQLPSVKHYKNVRHVKSRNQNAVMTLLHVFHVLSAETLMMDLFVVRVLRASKEMEGYNKIDETQK